MIRQLRDLVTPFKAARKTVVILASVLKIPPELGKHVTVPDPEMPDEAELAAMIDETVEQMRDNPKVEMNPGGRSAGENRQSSARPHALASYLTLLPGGRQPNAQVQDSSAPEPSRW